MERASLSPTQRILVALDLSDECPRLLKSAFRLAEQSPGTEVHVLTVAEPLRPVGTEAFPTGSVTRTGRQRTGGSQYQRKWAKA